MGNRTFDGLIKPAAVSCPGLGGPRTTIHRNGNGPHLSVLMGCDPASRCGVLATRGRTRSRHGPPEWRHGVRSLPCPPHRSHQLLTVSVADAMTPVRLSRLGCVEVWRARVDLRTKRKVGNLRGSRLDPSERANSRLSEGASSNDKYQDTDRHRSQHHLA